MSKIVFLKMDGEDQFEMRMGTDLTWMEVTERFVQFLQGVGYQVTTEDVGEYLMEITADYTGGDREDDFSTIDISSTTGDTDTIHIYTTDSDIPTSYNFNGQTMSSVDLSDNFFTITTTSTPKYSFNDLTVATNNWFTAPNKY